MRMENKNKISKQKNTTNLREPDAHQENDIRQENDIKRTHIKRTTKLTGVTQRLYGVEKPLPRAKRFKAESVLRSRNVLSRARRSLRRGLTALRAVVRPRLSFTA